jgi:hypothetical protein
LYNRKLIGIDAILIGTLSIAAVILYLQPLVSIGQRVPLNYNEGWNAYHAAAAIDNGELYPPPDALITNNYRPLSFYLVGAIGWFLGDNIIAGRAVAAIVLTDNAPGSERPPNGHVQALCQVSDGERQSQWLDATASAGCRIRAPRTPVRSANLVDIEAVRAYLPASRRAQVAELVDALDSGSSGRLARGSSSLLLGTISRWRLAA